MQKLVLTRSAFNAHMELENGETTALTNIRVDIVITDFAGGLSANFKFSIGVYIHVQIINFYFDLSKLI